MLHFLKISSKDAHILKVQKNQLNQTITFTDTHN